MRSGGKESKRGEKMTKIKICGLSRPCDIDYANALSGDLDYIGYVFWEKSRRNVTAGQAAGLTEKLDSSITPVGVFVDADCGFVAELLREGIIRAAQLHGHEDEEYVKRLREQTDAPVIKAFKVRSREDVEAANCFPSDYVLLDNGYGTGEVFDWSYAAEASRPFFLAGGMDEDTVRKVIRTMHPYGVDVSSGVETDGYKDYEKMKAFVKAVRNIELG